MALTEKVEFGWFIPTTGDGKHIGVPPERESTSEYMVEVAREAEAAGYEFVLIPAGGDCLDAWVVGSWIAARTTKLKTLVAMRPGLMAPVLAARMGATLDRMSGGRVLINIVTGHYPEDLKATGDPIHASHDERYERTREFVEIVKGVWTDEGDGDGKPRGFDYSGKHYTIEGGLSKPMPLQRPHPPLYFGGSSPAGKRAAAETADVYLMWAEPLSWIREQIAEMERELAAVRERTGAERSVRYGLRAQLVVRDTEEEAWDAAWEIISQADPKLRDSAEKLHAKTDALNQRRQMELWNESRDRQYVIGPNLWSGLSAIRGGGAVAIVGTPEQVSDRIVEFAQAGISSFILSGYPHLEEARISGPAVLPLVRRKLAELI
ncbi:LLM class flavin-dependent oxidoreductase [Cohnella zeiphila]|uniref:LLM class flavin-dependent oxidoreductase n=1 Tax=Cohnella zeiphila TaxID=2761120 RepID=A0A7X0SLV4_9BACL|nr:LLM class flavin-dependent oxidoreductase [Cohnella zeiphila]MBB6732331.1 LLM class flavin-dependent oxidoreductase [Cohnella zeiphila]